MKIGRVFIVFFIFTSIIFSKDLENVNVQLNWKHQFEHAGFYAAIEKGYYKELGLKVNLFEKKKGSSSFDEVMNGNADFAIGYSSLVLEYMSGKPVVALASIFQHSPLIFLSKQSSNIRTIADMVGRRVMLNPKSKSSASLNIMIKKEGVSYDDMILLDHTYNTEDLLNDTTEVLASYISNQPFEMIEKGVPFNIIDPVNYGYDFYENILFTRKNIIDTNPDLVSKFLKATLRGWKYALSNENELIELILNKYTKIKSKKALEYEARIIKNSLITKNIPVGNIDINRFKRIVELYEELGLLSKSEKDINKFIYKNGNEINLSTIQREWIAKHPQVYFTGNPNWLPYETFVDGEYIGVVNEHLKLIEEYTGLKFIKIPTTHWSESIDFAKKKYVDVLSETKSSLLKDKLTFTKSYLSSPIVMIMNKSESYKDSIDDIVDKKIAVIQEYGYVSEIRKNYPNLDYYIVDNIQDGLLSVENGEADVLLCALPQASYWMNKHGLQNIRIVGKTRFMASLAFGVRSDYQVLVQILNEAILKIPQTKQQDILTSWTKVKYNQKIDYTMLWIILAITTSIIIILVIRHRSLHEHNKELTYLSETDHLTKICNRSKLNKLLEDQIKLFKRYKNTFGIIIVDIDFFKSVNDEHGHNIGDIVLVEFAQVLKDNIRDVDFIGRWGGEEFLIICPRIDEIGIKKVAQKLHKVIIGYDFSIVGTKTASFGATVCTKEISIKQLIKNADIALYKVKESGRNGIKII